MTRRNIKLTLAYDGTDFAGWQIQRSERTVQGTLQSALKRMHKHEVKVTAAGRTDAGVHAIGQVANFFTDLNIPEEKLTDAINSYLPFDVRVLVSRMVSSRFSSRRSARLRIYRYRINNTSVELPHLRRYSLQVRQSLDTTLLNRLAAVLVGEHDFTAFAAAGDTNTSKVRRLYSSCFYPQGSFIVYKIAADSFLWKMVRSIIGTILEVVARGGDEREMVEILESKDRNRVGQTAPARGLFLDQVVFEDEKDTPLAF
jgi:tRNA pseudouridine38-40 synthase